VLVSLMGSSFLSEVDDTSILRTGALHRYHYPLTWLPASRLLPPRSGLERSDFVRCPDSDHRADVAGGPKGANSGSSKRTLRARYLNAVQRTVGLPDGILPSGKHPCILALAFL
jgi:hypothetical protein